MDRMSWAARKRRSRWAAFEATATLGADCPSLVRLYPQDIYRRIDGVWQHGGERSLMRWGWAVLLVLALCSWLQGAPAAALFFLLAAPALPVVLMVVLLILYNSVWREHHSAFFDARGLHLATRRGGNEERAFIPYSQMGEIIPRESYYSTNRLIIWQRRYYIRMATEDRREVEVDTYRTSPSMALTLRRLRRIPAAAHIPIGDVCPSYSAPTILKRRHDAARREELLRGVV